MLPPKRPGRWVARISSNLDGIDHIDGIYAGIAENCVDSGAVIADIDADRLRRQWRLRAVAGAAVGIEGVEGVCQRRRWLYSAGPPAVAPPRPEWIPGSRLGSSKSL